MASIKKFFKFFVFSPVFRKLFYLEKLHRKYKNKISSMDKKKLTELRSNLRYQLRFVEVYLPLKVISEFFLYSSVISTIIIYLPIPVLEDVVSYVVKLSGVIGSVFFLITTFLLSKFITKRSGDAEAIISHMISIYSRY